MNFFISFIVWWKYYIYLTISKDYPAVSEAVAEALGPEVGHGEAGPKLIPGDHNHSPPGGGVPPFCENLGQTAI